MTYDNLIEQVQRNCDISDAKFWGIYTICGFLMRMRELFRFRTGLKPWEPISPKDISPWLEERHNLWQGLEDSDYMPITIDGIQYEAFDSESINNVLNPEGLVYGAGFGIHMKPVFYLAKIISIDIMEGIRVITSGVEFARDLSLHPAMLQSKTILARRYVTETLIWEKFEEFISGRKGPLSEAFISYGLRRDIEPMSAEHSIRAISAEELSIYIFHEIGEAFENERLPLWPEMLAHAKGRASSILRAIKDSIADTSEKGMLKAIIERRKEGSLGFYISFLSGLRGIILKPVREAYSEFLKKKDWLLIEDARRLCHERAISLAENLSDVFKRDRDGFSEYIERLTLL